MSSYLKLQKETANLKKENAKLKQSTKELNVSKKKKKAQILEFIIYVEYIDDFLKFFMLRY